VFGLSILGLQLLRERRLKVILQSAAAYVGVCLAVLLPFALRHGFLGIIERIFLSGAGKYGLAADRAFNFMSLVGGDNVADSSVVFGGVSFFALGVGLAACALVAFSVHYLTRRQPDVWAGFAMVFYIAFMFLPRMHERYMIYVVPLFFVAACFARGWVYRFVYCAVTVVVFVNQAIIMWAVQNQLTRPVWIDSFNLFVVVCAAVNFVLFVGVCVVYARNPRPCGPPPSLPKGALRKLFQKGFEVYQRFVAAFGVEVSAV